MEMTDQNVKVYGIKLLEVKIRELGIKQTKPLNTQDLDGSPFNIDESAKTTNNINYAINGLCKTADQFLGGKAALTALNYFTCRSNNHIRCPRNF